MPSLQKILQQAIDTDQLIGIKYWPNKDGRTLMGWRYVYPIQAYQRAGKSYVLTYFMQGASVSKAGEGFRLFFTSNIQEAKMADDGPFGFKGERAQPSVILALKKQNLNHRCMMMVLRGEIE